MAISSRCGAEITVRIIFFVGKLALLLTLLSCSSTPMPPDWQVNSHGALNSAVAAYLKGNSRLAEIEFSRARHEIASTARLDLLARSMLVRCAARVASLELDNCPEYQPLATDAGPAEQAYASFILGRWESLQTALLPQQYHAFVATPSAATLAEIEDPLARLIAAGVLLRTHRIEPPALSLATQTASEQGWRRPLLAWLGVQAKLAEDRGNVDELAKIRRRMDLLTTQESKD